MPVIKSAIKKYRRDKKKEKENNVFRKKLSDSIRAAKKQKTSKTVAQAFSIVDKAVKKNMLHKNKAARIKSSLSKLAKPIRPIQGIQSKQAQGKLTAATAKTKKTVTKKAPTSARKTKTAK